MAAIFLLAAWWSHRPSPVHPATFGMIFQYAFQPGHHRRRLWLRHQDRISQGAKRGLFSNEAGMGSTPHAHAQANVTDPHDQGVVAMIGVFMDTFVVLTLNALVVISTLYTAGGPLAECGAAAASTTLGKANLAQTAFGVVFGETAGAMFVAVCLFFFAFSTILSWNLFGKINVIYLFGKQSAKIYAVLGLVFIFLGTLMSNDLVWELTDMFNNLMSSPTPWPSLPSPVWCELHPYGREEVIYLQKRRGKAKALPRLLVVHLSNKLQYSEIEIRKHCIFLRQWIPTCTSVSVEPVDDRSSQMY